MSASMNTTAVIRGLGAALAVFAVTYAPANDSFHGLSSAAAAFTRTEIVSPVGSNTRINCKYLQDTLIGITDNDEITRYLIKLEPGVYECTDPHIPMKPYVDIEGSGRGVTTIVGSNPGTGSEIAALVRMAEHTELRDLTVINNAKIAGPDAVTVLADTVTDARISRVHARIGVEGGGDRAHAIRFAGGGALTLDNVRAVADGSADRTCGVAAQAEAGQTGVLTLSNVVAIAGGDSGRRIGLCAEALGEEPLRVHVRDSVLQGPDRSVEEAGGTVTIAHSQLIGPATSTAPGDAFLVKEGVTSGPDRRQMRKPAVAALSDGGFAVTWMNVTAPGGDWQARIEAQRFDANGNTVGPEITVRPDVYLGSLSPVHSPRPLAADGLADGGFVVMWKAMADSGSSWIYGEKIDHDGNIANLDIQITRGDSERDAAVAGLTDGGFVAAWCSNRYDADARQQVDEVFVRRFDPDGSESGPDVMVARSVLINPTETDTAKKVWSQHCNPSVAGLSDGDFVVAWQTAGHLPQPENNDIDVNGALYERDASGTFTPVALEFPPPDLSMDDQVRASVAGLADGAFMVSWATADYWWEGQGGNPTGGLPDMDIAAAVFAPDGTVVADLLVNEGTHYGQQPGDHMQRLNDSTGLTEGGFVVTWLAANDGRIERRLYDAEGAVLSAILPVSDNSGPVQSGYGRPSTDGLAGGGHVVAWSHNDTVWARILPGSVGGPKCVYVYDENYDALGADCGPLDLAVAGGP